MATGFGQQGIYVWMTAIVRNNTQQVGQTVTVNFLVRDATGRRLATRTEVESFSQPGVDHVVGTQVEVQAGEAVTQVEATLVVEDKGAFSSTPFPPMPVTTPVVANGDSNSKVATFELTNPQSVPLQKPRIGIACVDVSGTIVGGGVTYPEIVPAGGTVKVDADVILSGSPSSCSVFTGAPADWGATTPSGSATAPGSATAAFETWVNRMGARDWAGQYETLVSAQQALISQESFVNCRNAGQATWKWLGVVSTWDVATNDIPGTTASLPATFVKAMVQVSGLTVPDEAPI